MVEIAKKWRNVGKQNSCELIGSNAENVVQPNDTFSLILDVTKADCPNINYLEHVQINFSASARKRGDVELSLISPFGTKMVIVPTRKLDFSPEGFSDWIILCMQLWGENPYGKWQLSVANKGKFSSRLTKPIRFQGWALRLYGTKEDPDIN